jgi:hypothetical protein
VTTEVLDYLDEKGKGSAKPGYKGSGKYKNKPTGSAEKLPEVDANGDPITYQEWDINPYVEGQNRGLERVVTGDDGSAYYTDDHYDSFTRIR